MVQRLPGGYLFDPADPRAPTEEQWAAMSPAEREQVADMLPPEPDVDFLPPPEGDPHWDASASARLTLQSFSRKRNRKLYVSGNIAVYYPGERLFAPDVIAVTDVEPHDRNTWVVEREGKGLDLALEIHVAGERAKDVKENVRRYARLGVHEYFVFDRGRLTLTGYRLPATGKKRRAYQPIAPQGGRLPSAVLGLDLALEGTALRFYEGAAALPDVLGLLPRLEGLLGEAEARARAEERAQAAEARVVELLAEIERLRGGKG